ncbi:Protein of unknown function, partial [Gryllus bimaculatus]
MRTWRRRTRALVAGSSAEALKFVNYFVLFLCFLFLCILRENGVFNVNSPLLQFALQLIVTFINCMVTAFVNNCINDVAKGFYTRKLIEIYHNAEFEIKITYPL